MPLNTFRHLFDDDKKVTIPMIQRDYAQGRKKELKIREGFVKSLEDLINGKGGSLDFIYRRSTTAFLLLSTASKGSPPSICYIGLRPKESRWMRLNTFF